MAKHVGARVAAARAVVEQRREDARPGPAAPATSAPAMLEMPAEVGEGDGHQRADHQERRRRQRGGREREQHARPARRAPTRRRRRRAWPGSRRCRPPPPPARWPARRASAGRCGCGAGWRPRGTASGEHDEHDEAERGTEVVGARRRRCRRRCRTGTAGARDAPAAPPESDGLASTSCSMATAMARVATARLMPRTRVAGRPTSTPTQRGDSAASDAAASGNGTPSLGQPGSTVNPATPAMASWASEIWPTYPVTTTTDSASSANDHRHDQRLAVRGVEA